MVENKMWLPFVGLKLDNWPRSTILELLFIARHPRRVPPTSFTGDVTTKLADWGLGWSCPRTQRSAPASAQTQTTRSRDQRTNH